MFGWFGKKKDAAPPRFEALRASGMGHLYFARAAQWLEPQGGDMITVIDPHQPRMITMDPWPQRIFLDADGQRTIAQYVRLTARQFPRGSVPAELDEMLIYNFRELAENLKVLTLSPEPVELPPELAGPAARGKPAPG